MKPAVVTLTLWEAQDLHKRLKAAKFRADSAHQMAKVAEETAWQARSEAHSALTAFESHFVDACEKAGMTDFSEFVTIEKDSEPDEHEGGVPA